MLSLSNATALYLPCSIQCKSKLTSQKHKDSISNNESVKLCCHGQITALFLSCSIEYNPKLTSQKHYSNVKAISDLCACISRFLKQIKVSTKLKTFAIRRDTAFLRNAKIALPFFSENVQSRNSLRMKLCRISFGV